MDNVLKITKALGKDLKDVVKINIYLAFEKYFDIKNEVFAEYFNENPPARTRLVSGFVNPHVLVEIYAVLD